MWRNASSYKIKWVRKVWLCQATIIVDRVEAFTMCEAINPQKFSKNRWYEVQKYYSQEHPTIRWYTVRDQFWLVKGTVWEWVGGVATPRPPLDLSRVCVCAVITTLPFVQILSTRTRHQGYEQWVCASLPSCVCLNWLLATSVCWFPARQTF